MTAFLYQRSLGDSLPNPTHPYRSKRSWPTPTSRRAADAPRSSLASIPHVASRRPHGVCGSMTGSPVSTAVTLNCPASHLARRHVVAAAVRDSPWARPALPQCTTRWGLHGRRGPGLLTVHTSPAGLPWCSESREAGVAASLASAIGVEVVGPRGHLLLTGMAPSWSSSPMSLFVGALALYRTGATRYRSGYAGSRADLLRGEVI